MDQSSEHQGQPAIKQYGFDVRTPLAAGAGGLSSTPPPRPSNLEDARRSLGRKSPGTGIPKATWSVGSVHSDVPLAKSWTKQTLSPGFQQGHAPRSLPHWDKNKGGASLADGFASHDSALEDRGSLVEQWALPAKWRHSESPSGSQNLQAHASTSSSEFAASSAFKGFKDGCEAGSFSLGPAQAVHESGRLEVVGTLHTSEGVRSLVKEVIGGLRAWQQPEVSSEGLGGTYFFMDEKGSKRAIVKPCDEEPLAPNNPKGFVGRALGEPGLKPTVRVGEAAMREVAAFLLDHQRFANVPHTALVRVTHNCFHVAVEEGEKGQAAGSELAPSSSLQSSSSHFSSSNNMASTIKPQIPRLPPSKLASMQEFIVHQGDSSEMGFSRFSAKDVHRIGILDLRLFNTDRHAGNMLVKHVKRSSPASGVHSWLEDRLELIPIDHGFCLPEALEPPYLEWLHWPQAKLPFDEEELQYIASLDANADILFLQQELPWIPEGSLRTLQVATMLLTKCAAAGLTLAEIGNIASRPLVGMDEEASELEKVCMSARQKVDLEASLAEEGEGFSDSDSDVMLEVGVLDAVAEADESVGDLEGRTSFVMGHKIRVHSALSGDEMLFDLEEESEQDSISTASAPSSPMAMARAPSRALKPCQSASNVPPPSALPQRVAVAKKEGFGQTLDLAKSLHSGLHPRTVHQRRSRRLRNLNMATQHRHERSKHRQSHAAYPPHVVGQSAALMNNVFEGLQRASWTTFVQELDTLIEDALEAGVWRQQAENNSSASVGFGMSCPRF